MKDIDHPIEHDLVGYCTGCRRIFDWRGLRPMLSPQGRVMVLCGRCDFLNEPRCKESDG